MQDPEKMLRSRPWNTVEEDSIEEWLGIKHRQSDEEFGRRVEAAMKGECEPWTPEELYGGWMEIAEVMMETERNHRARQSEKPPKQQGKVKQEKTYGPRMLNLNGPTNLEEIWNEAERRIGTDRSHFALVYQSHYLEQVGTYKEPIHFLEVRYSGGECQVFWKVMEHLAFNFEVEWIKKELEETEAENIRPDKVIKHLHRAVAEEMKPKASAYWKNHQASVPVISKNQFKMITAATLNRMHYQAWTMALADKASKWSTGRQRVVIDAVQKIDSATDMKIAEDMWKEVLKSQIFKGVGEETLEDKASEIRAICWDEEKRKGLVDRIWKDLRGLRWKQAETSSYIRNHLRLYKEQKEWILADLKQRLLEEIMRAGSRETRNVLWHRMIALSGVKEAPNTHAEYRVYKLWWIAIHNSNTLLAKETEWNKAADHYAWEGFKLDGRSLRSWATEKTRKSACGQIPCLLREVSRSLELEEGRKREILDSYFRELEGE
jgi:hypothetical protein